MEKICEQCNKPDCGFVSRNIQDDCERVQDYQQGYDDAVDKVCTWLRTYLPSIYLTGMSSVNEYEIVDMYIEAFKKDMEGGDNDN